MWDYADNRWWRVLDLRCHTLQRLFWISGSAREVKGYSGGHPSSGCYECHIILPRNILSIFLSGNIPLGNILLRNIDVEVTGYSWGHLSSGCCECHLVSPELNASNFYAGERKKLHLGGVTSPQRWEKEPKSQIEQLLLEVCCVPSCWKGQHW